MKKTINKIFGLFSFGLLLFAAEIPYAQASGEIKHQDAWSFMKEHTSDGGSAFRASFGQESDLKSTKVVCGKRLCNIALNTCMEKKVQNRDSDYICVRRKEISRFEKVGYSVIAGGATSTSKTEDLGEQCYQVKKTGASGDNMKATVYCAKSLGDKIEVSVGETESHTCDVIEVSWYNFRKCTFCSMIGVIYGVADKIAVIAQVNLARSFAIVIAVGLMVWLAIKTLTFVSDVSRQDASTYITELITQSFKFLLAFFALIFYRQAFDLLIIPLIRSGMTFGASFASVETLYSRFGADIFNAIVTASATGDASGLMGMDNVPADYVRNAGNKFFDLYTYATMENLAYNVNLQYSLLQVIGKGLMCTGMTMFTGGFAKILESFGLSIACIVYGLCFGVFGFLLSLAFVFYLLDAVVQIGIFAGILPFLIACWPFNLTKKYTKTGFDMLINSILVFALMGAVASLSIELIRAAVEFNVEGGSQTESNNGLSEMANALSELDINKLDSMVNILSLGFILFIIANMMAMLFLKKVTEFAGKFSSGVVPSIASGLAGTAASAAKGAVIKAGTAGVSSFSSGFSKKFNEKTEDLKEEVVADVKAIGGTVKGGIKKVANNVSSSTKRFVRSTMNKTNAGRAVMSGYDKYKDARSSRLQSQQEQKDKEKQKKQEQNKEKINNILG